MAAVVCLHETGTGAAVWEPLSEAVGDRLEVVAFDRFGWRDDTPEDYRATTIEEQAEDAGRRIEEEAIVCGAGLGAVIALELLLGRPRKVSAAVMIESPLLAFSAAATEALSEDRVELRAAVQEGGAAAGVELCLSGGLAALSPGTDRLSADLTESARARPASLFAELAAVPAWSIPAVALRANERPARIVTSAGTPSLVREASDSLGNRLGSSQRIELSGAGPAHLDAAGEFAELLFELSRAA